MDKRRRQSNERELEGRPSHPAFAATALMIGVALLLVLIAAAGVMT